MNHMYVITYTVRILYDHLETSSNFQLDYIFHVCQNPSYFDFIYSLVITMP